MFPRAPKYRKFRAAKQRLASLLASPAVSESLPELKHTQNTDGTELKESLAMEAPDEPESEQVMEKEIPLAVMVPSEEINLESREPPPHEREITAFGRSLNINKPIDPLLDFEGPPVHLLRRVIEYARRAAYRPIARKKRPTKYRKRVHPVRPRTPRELLGREVKKHGEKVPLRKVTYYVLSQYRWKLPSAAKFRLPEWAEAAMSARGFRAEDALAWARVLRAKNATGAFAIMDEMDAVWPKFLVESLLHSNKKRTQTELFKIISLVEYTWDRFDQGEKIAAAVRMAELAAKQLPHSLSRIAKLVSTTEFQGRQPNLKVFNNLLALTADAYHLRDHHIYTTVNLLRDKMEHAMIKLLRRMEEDEIEVTVGSLTKVGASKLGEDQKAAVQIIRLGDPSVYIALVNGVVAGTTDSAMTYEIEKVESQLSAVERAFIRAHLVGRVTSAELAKRLAVIRRWRVSTAEIFSAWLDFFNKRQHVGKAPRANWADILKVCLKEYKFPDEFWEEAFLMMEADRCFPSTELTCLVLQGIRDTDTLERIVENLTSRHFQRMNDKIWKVFLTRLSLENAPRALEIFLDAHQIDSAQNTMDTLDVEYWNIMLHALANEYNQTKDPIWVGRCFNLLDEMNRLVIFPTQESLKAVLRMGEAAGDRVYVEGGEEKGTTAAWAAIDQWFKWVIRPEDFDYEFPLSRSVRIHPSQSLFRRFFRLCGKAGDFATVYNTTYALLRFGVIPHWETLLDIDLFMQLAKDETRTTTTREMLREWLKVYPTPREVHLHYRNKYGRPLVKEREQEMYENLPLFNTPDYVPKFLEAPPKHVPPTVIDEWLSREGAKPWFERG